MTFQYSSFPFRSEIYFDIFNDNDDNVRAKFEKTMRYKPQISIEAILYENERCWLEDIVCIWDHRPVWNERQMEISNTEISSAVVMKISVVVGLSPVELKSLRIYFVSFKNDWSSFVCQFSYSERYRMIYSSLFIFLLELSMKLARMKHSIHCSKITSRKLCSLENEFHSLNLSFTELKSPMEVNIRKFLLENHLNTLSKR